jgi:hypothetical protein
MGTEEKHPVQRNDRHDPEAEGKRGRGGEAN